MECYLVESLLDRNDFFALLWKLKMMSVLTYNLEKEKRDWEREKV